MLKQSNITKKALIIILLLVVFMNTIISTNVYAGSKRRYCIEITPKITDTVYDYLNEIYIKKYPRLGTEFSFGTDADKAVLEKLAKMITNGIKTDKEKAKAIASWISNNVEYASYQEDETSYFAIDVFYRRKGNCLGYANTLSQLCRLCKIPAVMCGGTRGNMEENVTLDDRVEDHAWAMIYYDNDWHLYDPLFNEIDKTNRQYISKWYFFEDIEGVTPYVKGYEKYFHNGTNTFYINNRFVAYMNDKPYSEYAGCGIEGGISYNGHVPYLTKNKYLGPDNCIDGYNYIDGSNRKDKMVNNEAYTNGWIIDDYSKYIEQYAKENGSLAQCTLKEYNGQLYYLPYGQSALKIKGKSSDYTLTDGLMTLKVGNSINLQPTWIESQKNEFERKIYWESTTPETAKVDQNGTITGLKDGYACIDVYSREREDDKIGFSRTSIELIISSKDRKAIYNTVVLKDKCDITMTATKTYTGKLLTPKVTVKYDNKTLKNGVDYTLTFKNNKKVGTATAVIKFKGNYSGKIKKTFKIIPKKTSIKKLDAKSKGFKIKINKQTAQTTGYQIQYATNSEFTTNKKTVTIKKNTETTKTISKLKANKKYYVRVRTYKTVNGKKYYSSWSKVKTVKTKK